MAGPLGVCVCVGGSQTTRNQVDTPYCQRKSDSLTIRAVNVSWKEKEEEKEENKTRRQAATHGRRKNKKKERNNFFIYFVVMGRPGHRETNVRVMMQDLGKKE